MSDATDPNSSRSPEVTPSGQNRRRAQPTAVHRPLRGRDDERRALGEVIAAAADGFGRLVLFRGAGGSGKSRLLQEAAALADATGVCVVAGGGETHARLTPGGPLLAALTGGDRPLIDPGLLRRSPAGSQWRSWMIEELRDGLESVAAEDSLLILLDDLHWFDDFSLLALRTLCADLATNAVGWVLTTRDEPRRRVLADTVKILTRYGGRTMDLRPLSASAVDDIAADFLGRKPTGTVANLVHRTGGSPLFLTELLSGLQEDQRAGATPVTPRRLEDVIRSRFLLLSQPARELLQAAALLGRPIVPDDAARLLGADVREMSQAAQEAAGAGLLTVAGPAVTVAHDVVRTAVVATIPEAVRRPLHRQLIDLLLAQGVAPVQVATDLADIAEPGDTAAAELLRDAALELEVSDPAGAARIIRRAVEIVPARSGSRADILSAGVDILGRAGEVDQAVALAESALGRTSDPGRRAILLARLSLLTLLSDPERSSEYAQDGLLLAGAPVAVRADLAVQRLTGLNLTGRADGVDDAIEDGYRLARAAGDRASLAGIDIQHAFVEVRKAHWERAAVLLGPYDGRPTGAGEPGRPVTARTWEPVLLRCGVLAMTGHSQDGLVVLEASATSAGAGRELRSSHHVLLARARLLSAAGRLPDAAAEAEAALAVSGGIGGDAVSDIMSAAYLCRVSALIGDLAGVRRAVTIADEVVKLEPRLVQAYASWIRVVAADAAGDRGSAAESLAALLDLHFAGAAGFPEIEGVEPADTPWMVSICGRAGRDDLVGRLIDLAADRATANPSVHLFSAVARHARGLADRAPDMIAEAIGLYDRTQNPLPGAAAHENLAGMVAPDQAVASLATCLSVYEAVGADREAARAYRSLRSLGVHKARRKPAGSTGAPLTPTERQVVRLVVQGARNKQVADTLFLSPHTVSTHLRHVFTKLGVRSRVELTRLVAGTGLLDDS